MERKIERALISVSDKSGIVELAQFLESQGVEILSTGGTSKLLKDSGVTVKDVSEHTKSPEIMDGRVKTLHPKIHGGILACLDNPEHEKAMRDNDIGVINLVVVNLYPFEETVARGADFDEVIENIDIGGPSMVRSAAKNHAFTTIVTDIADYKLLQEQIQENNGFTTKEFRRSLAAKAFAKTASYDSTISNWFACQEGQQFPDKITVSMQINNTLRYGENPHQQAAYYNYSGVKGILGATQLQGKELSFNNLNDTDAALQLVKEFEAPAAAIIKHANPCGVGVGKDVAEAFTRALASDPVSAFGGIFAFNREVDEELVEKIGKMFVEVIIAPGITDAAKEKLSSKKNMRLLITEENTQTGSMQMRTVTGGLLLQSIDKESVSKDELEIVTERQPEEQEIDDMLFANIVCKHVKSNAIVLVKNGATIGIGAGQMSRVDSVRIAVMKATDSDENKNKLNGAILASDAFFPFADGLETAAKAGIKAVIQPGGSVRDEEVINAANEHNIAMAVTGKRFFKH